MPKAKYDALRQQEDEARARAEFASKKWRDGDVAKREHEAEVAALRTEREEAVRLLREVGGGPHSLSMCPWPLRQEVTAFLARTDTGTKG